MRNPNAALGFMYGRDSGGATRILCQRLTCDYVPVNPIFLFEFPLDSAYNRGVVGENPKGEEERMQNKLKGIIFFGILFIFLGLSFLGSARFFYLGKASNQIISLIDNAVTTTLKEMKVLEAEKEQVKLRASGKLEQFNKEYNDFKQEFKRLTEKYKAKLPHIDRLLFIIYLLAGISSLIAGIGLIAHQSWGRYISYLSIFSLCSSYILNWYAIYPFIFISNFLSDRVNTLNLLIDPIDPAYKVLSKYAGQSAFKQMLFGYPMVISHLLVIAIVGATLCYLSRPKFKAFLK